MVVHLAVESCSHSTDNFVSDMLRLSEREQNVLFVEVRGRRRCLEVSKAFGCRDVPALAILLPGKRKAVASFESHSLDEVCKKLESLDAR